MNNNPLSILLKANGRAAMMGFWFLGLSYAFTGQIIPGIY